MYLKLTSASIITVQYYFVECVRNNIMYNNTEICNYNNTDEFILYVIIMNNIIITQPQLIILYVIIINHIKNR